MGACDSGAESKGWVDIPLIKNLREIYDVPEKEQCENVQDNNPASKETQGKIIILIVLLQVSENTFQS